MEDYAVGSLSDLITGKVTANKKTVVKKEVTQIRNSPKKAKRKQVKVEETDNLEVQNTTKKAKRIKVEKIDNSEFEGKKVSKKRSQPFNDEDAPVPKKSKHEENAERRIKLKVKKETPKIEEDPELTARTIFVGNLPINLSTKKIEKHFAKHGKVDSVRIRGVPVANPNTPKKVAVIKKEFHPKRNSYFGYIRYMNRDDAIKALEENGSVFHGHHLRVHLCDAINKPEQNKAIFVGNLSFYAEDDDLWKTFDSCGPIESVRIVRDVRTGIGKGFGYVNFKNSDSVTLALEMENVKVKDRELRIKMCEANAAKKKTKLKKNKVPKIIDANEEIKQETQVNYSKETSSSKQYQGVQFTQKKKKKHDKGLLQKKKIVKQIAPK